MSTSFKRQVPVPGTGGQFGYPVEIDGIFVGYVAKHRSAGWDGKDAVWRTYDNAGNYRGSAPTRAKAARSFTNIGGTAS